MEKEQENQRRGATEPDFLLQWGNRKRLRCVKIRNEAGSSSPVRSDGQRRATSCINRRVIRGTLLDESDNKGPPPPLFTSPVVNNRKSDSVGSENRKSRSVSSSPEKEDRYYATRGSLMGCEEKDNGNGSVNGFGMGSGGEEKGVMVLPRFFVSLSNKEKEQDFLAMKGCKLPQRPRKRSKYLKKCLLLVSPGAWLTDLTQERYEVREKKSSRKRKRGLKAIAMESDSD